jgi:hypothetical protein
VSSRRRAFVGAFQAICLAAALPGAASAQALRGSLEVGAARLSQRDVPRTDAVTAALTFRRDQSRYTLAAAGGITLAEEGRSTTQGLFAASLLGAPGRRTRWEVGGAVTAFDQGDFPLARGAYLLAREHFVVGRFGGWAGVAVGGVEDLGHWSPTRSAEIGSWFGRRDLRLSAAALLVDTRSEPYGTGGQLITDPVTYTDGSVGARWLIQRRAELDARAGLRFISRGAATATGRGTRPFAAVDAAFWVTPRFALVAAVGRQLADLSRGTPDTRFASFALRFSVHEPAGVPEPVRRRPPAIAHRLDLTLITDTAGGGRSRLVVTASGGGRIEVAGTFTSWEPVPLIRRGDLWELDREIPSGAHRLLVRVDGGAWVVPANLPTAGDDFGGTVGIITVP